MYVVSNCAGLHFRVHGNGTGHSCLLHAEGLLGYSSTINECVPDTICDCIKVRGSTRLADIKTVETVEIVKTDGLVISFISFNLQYHSTMDTTTTYSSTMALGLAI